MDIILFFQFLGYHLPMLGAFLVTILVVTLLCLIAYKLGKHEANKRWQWNVEHMPAVIGQDIREGLERRAERAETREALTRERLNQLLPLSSGVIDLVKRSGVGK